ncbi:MAG: sigma-70 family RNA polymerase sigma factor [Chitinophagaceae bacterium]|nr:sigma-70 family RNA polymerase sigma factor [Rubrivivax sp.]
MRSDEQQLLTWVPRLRRYARALAPNRDDADDLVQDTLERAWLKSGLWRGVADMRAWLFSIMHNVHVDGARRPRLQTVAIDDDTPEVPVAPNQSERLEVMDLQAALEQLPLEQKEIVLLVALEDMAYADVAKALDIPIGTVMSRLSRGRERLRVLMAGRADVVQLQVVRKTP